MKKFDIIVKQLPQVAYPAGEGFVLRPHQRKEYDASTYQLRAMVAAGGSGKTVTQQACAVKEIRASGFMQRQLITAPQSQICQQFAKKILLRLDCSESCFNKKSKKFNCTHKITPWQVRPQFNLADDTSKSVIDRLESFIMRPLKVQESYAKKLKVINSTEGLVLVTTHAAIVRVFTERILPKLESGEYTKAQIKQAVCNLTNRTDESHHVGNFTTKETNDQNGLGAWLSFCYKNGNETSRIFLTTATPYREQAVMMDANLFKKFRVSVLPFSEWCKNLGIREISLTLEEYDGTPIKAVSKNIGKEPRERHLVVHPSDGDKWLANLTKAAAVRRMKRAIAKVLPKDSVIVDTISTTGRRQIKRELIQNPHAANVVLTNKVVREGVDVPSLSRIHHTAMEQSKWLAVQTLYRVMRKHESKSRVEIRYYVPRLMDVCRIKTREEFSDRVNLTLLLADLRDLCDPLLTLTDIKTLGKYAKAFSGKEKVGLDDIFTVLNVDGEDIKDDVYLKLDLLKGEKGVKTKAAMLSVIKSVLCCAGVSKADVKTFKLDSYLLADYLFSLEEPSNKQAAVTLQKMKFDLRLDPMEYIRTKFDGIADTAGVYSGAYTPKSMDNLRKIFLNWHEMNEKIYQKLLKVAHLPKAERHKVLTLAELAWVKMQETKKQTGAL